MGKPISFFLLPGRSMVDPRLAARKGKDFATTPVNGAVPLFLQAIYQRISSRSSNSRFVRAFLSISRFRSSTENFRQRSAVAQEKIQHGQGDKHEKQKAEDLAANPAFGLDGDVADLST